MLKLDNVSKFYRTQEQVVTGLRRVSVELERNEFVAIVGESGSGKTTLLNVLSGNDTYDEGEFYINSEESSAYSKADWEEYRKQYVGFIFQDYNVLESFSVLDNVIVALTLMNYEESKRKERAIEILKRVGLGSHLHHKAAKLSGGQMQRLVIARALAKDTPIIACDEPTGNLDSESGRKIIELLAEISKDKLVIIVTHNYPEVEKYVTRKLRMYDGELVEDEHISHITPLPLEPVEKERTSISFKDLFKLSVKSLFATPKKNILAFLIFLLSTLSLISSYGAFVSSISGGSSGQYNTYYGNMMENRLILNKKDGTAFSTDELNAIRNNNNVRMLTTYDLGIESTISLIADTSDKNGRINFQSKPLSISYLKSTDLISGRLPENINEVVITTANNRPLEECEKYYSKTFRTSGLGDSMPLEVKVVGIANHESLRLSSSNQCSFWVDDFIERMHYLTYYRYSTYVIYETYDVNGNLISDITQGANLPINSSDSVTRTMVIRGEPAIYSDATILIKDVYQTRRVEHITLVYTSDFGDNIPSVTQDIADEMYSTDLDTYQISVFATYNDRIDLLINAYKKNYNIVVPSRIETTDSLGHIVNLISVILAVIVIGINLLAAYFITYLVMCALSGSKVKQYLILRSIGADKRTVSQELLIENVLVSTVASVLTIIGTIIIRFTVPDSIYSGIKIGEYLVIFIAVLALSVLVSLRLTRRLFKRSLAVAFKDEI